MKYSDVMNFVIELNNLFDTYGDKKSKEYMRIIMNAFIYVHGDHINDDIPKNGLEKSCLYCRESENKNKFKECLRDTIQEHNSKNMYNSGLSEDEVYSMLSTLQRISEGYDSDISNETREFNGRIMEEKNAATANFIADLKNRLEEISIDLDHISKDL